MADITKLKTDIYLWQPSTVSNPSLKLARACWSTDTTIYSNFEPKNKSWASITDDVYIWVKKSNWFVETMLVTTIAWTIWTVTRWINVNWLDLTTWTTTFADTHEAWEPIIFCIPAVFMQQIFSFLQWTIWSWANTIKIWDWADSDIYFYAFNADWNKPYVRYDAWDSKWYFSNDWVTDLDMASWGVSTASNWVQIVTWDISLNLDTNSWLWISANKVRVNLNWLTAKTTIVDADKVWIIDSAASFLTKVLTWANLKLQLVTDLPPSESAVWLLEKATVAECITWTDTDRAVTPAWLKARIANSIWAPVSKTPNWTIYQAATDWFVNFVQVWSAWANALWYTDASTTPTTVVAAGTSWSFQDHTHFLFVVKKSDYYKVTWWFWTMTFIPIWS